MHVNFKCDSCRFVVFTIIISNSIIFHIFIIKYKFTIFTWNHRINSQNKLSKVAKMLIIIFSIILNKLILELNKHLYFSIKINLMFFKLSSRLMWLNMTRFGIIHKPPNTLRQWNHFFFITNPGINWNWNMFLCSNIRRSVWLFSRVERNLTLSHNSQLNWISVLLRRFMIVMNRIHAFNMRVDCFFGF